ncbi:hypothetical protein L7F22_017541 [Adiantum nelumboides]|nr:hypothetical protein [Adiantum nelumboides]
MFAHCLLLMQYRLPRVGSRSAVGCAVLNDKWVSATSGSEDHSFKCMRKNEYEEILRLCEDDRTDLDILLEYVSSTVRGLQKLLKLLSKHGEVVVDDHILARHRGLILLIYSGCGLEVMECLHQEPGVVTPVILKRVKQKQREWLSPACRNQKFDSREEEKPELIGVVHAWKEFLEPMVGVQCDEWEDKELGQKLEDLGTEVRYSVPQGEGFNQYSEADAREEGQVSPSLMAEEKFWDSDTRHSTRAMSEKPSSYCSACENLEIVHSYENKKGAIITVEVTSDTGAAMHANSKYEGQRSTDEGNGLMVTSNGRGSAESENCPYKVLPLFTRETSASLIGDSVIFYGNDSMYILLRIYQALYERMKAAKVYAATKEGLFSEVYKKTLTGNHGDLFFAIDKLIGKLVKQLKVMASDEVAIKLLALHTYERLHAPNGIQDGIYQANARGLLPDESIYRFERASVSESRVLEVFFSKKHVPF